MPDLRAYQTEAVHFLNRTGRGILALPPGTGKTATVADWLPTGRCLIICPNGPVLHHWYGELAQWADVQAVIGVGTKPARDTKRRSVAGGDFPALILNYECMRQDIDELVKIPWDAVVFDESHRLKGRTTLVAKSALKLARRTPNLVLCTGTPLLNHPEELFTSLQMIEPKRYTSFWTWAERRFEITFRKHKGRLVREVGDMLPGVAEIIGKELGKVMYLRPLEELLPDLPAVTETYLDISLSQAERTMHESMRKDFWMRHGDELVIAPNKISQTLRLRQLASDWSTFGGGDLGSKGKACVQLLEDIGEPAIVFCAFRGTVEALHAEIPSSVPFHGGMSQDLRRRALHDFIEGRRRVLIGTIATMGEGIDGMQRIARNVIFVDRDWTPARNEQAVARLRRSGQQSNVNVIHLVATDSMDGVVSEALRRKENVIEAVLDAAAA